MDNEQQKEKKGWFWKKTFAALLGLSVVMLSLLFAANSIVNFSAGAVYGDRSMTPEQLNADPDLSDSLRRDVYRLELECEELQERLEALEHGKE